MLASGAGQIVPFDNPQALAEAVCQLAEQPDLLARARAEARRIGSQLTWPSVASATAKVLREAATHAPRRTPFRPAVLPRTEIEQRVSPPATTVP
jgi:hypothetical protein